MPTQNTEALLTQSGELNYHFIIKTTKDSGLDSIVHNYHNHSYNSDLKKIDFHDLGASFVHSTHVASNPLEASSAKSSHMEGDIFFFFGLFCLFSVFFSMYYVLFAPTKN